jgi:hypothetical protein
MTSSDITDGEQPRYVRLQIELIAQITDEAALKEAVVKQVQSDTYMDDDERAQALEAVEVDPSTALAHFIDPVQVLGEIPGVELAQASWESVHAEFDPDNEDWDLYDEADIESRED